MKCDEKICQGYEEIIACQAQGILNHIEKICMRELQKRKRDSGKTTSKRPATALSLLPFEQMRTTR